MIAKGVSLHKICIGVLYCVSISIVVFVIVLAYGRPLPLSVRVLSVALTVRKSIEILSRDL